MTDLLEQALDDLVPSFADAEPAWDDVKTRAALKPGPRRSSRRRPVVAAFAASATLAALIMAVILAWPTSEHGSVLDRAAAAIGDGPVLHVTVASGFGATSVNLATGDTTFVHGEEELWFDPNRGIRDISKFRGVLQGDQTYPPGRVEHLDKTLTFLATGYRAALKNKTARVIGDDTIDGAPVIWIRVDSQMLPDTSDGKLHDWAHDVAVSAETFKPVATRETRDGALGPDGISKIASIETLPTGSGDFSAPSAPVERGPMSFARTGSLTLDQARDVLGQAALTAGPSVDGLALSRIAKEVRRQGLNRATGEWKTTHEGVTLFYGAPEGGGVGEPPPTGDYLQVSETTTPDDEFVRGVRGYFPPEGALLSFGGHYGLMQHNGVYLALEASSEKLLVDAAEKLSQ